MSRSFPLTWTIFIFSLGRCRLLLSLHLLWVFEISQLCHPRRTSPAATHGHKGWCHSSGVCVLLWSQHTVTPATNNPHSVHPLRKQKHQVQRQKMHHTCTHGLRRVVRSALECGLFTWVPDLESDNIALKRSFNPQNSLEGRVSAFDKITS